MRMPPCARVAARLTSWFETPASRAPHHEVNHSNILPHPEEAPAGAVSKGETRCRAGRSTALADHPPGERQASCNQRQLQPVAEQEGRQATLEDRLVPAEQHAEPEQARQVDEGGDRNSGGEGKGG